MANTEFADTVGRIFFNVIRTQCYIYKMEKVCLERTWWGKCTKEETLKKAEWREIMPYD